MPDPKPKDGQKSDAGLAFQAKALDRLGQTLTGNRVTEIHLRNKIKDSPLQAFEEGAIDDVAIARTLASLKLKPLVVVDTVGRAILPAPASAASAPPASCGGSSSR